MTENDFRRIVADNLIFYRKRASLTQAEVAAYINYSDKSVSKWERGDGCPDAFVLNLLAEKYGVTINELTSERTEDAEPAELSGGDSAADEAAAEPVFEKVAHSPFTVLLAVGAVWLISTIIFSILNMNGSRPATWLAFIYAVPASFAMVELFAIKWKMPAIMHLLFGSGAIWTLMVSIHLTAHNVENIYLIYVVAAVAQLLGIFGLGLYWQMIRLPQKKRKAKK